MIHNVDSVYFIVVQHHCLHFITIAISFMLNGVNNNITGFSASWIGYSRQE